MQNQPYSSLFCLFYFSVCCFCVKNRPLVCSVGRGLKKKKGTKLSETIKKCMNYVQEIYKYRPRTGMSFAN